jgi:23S rRNA pseudouridine955/2504/2580 synthase
VSAPRTSLPLGEHDEGRRLDRILRRLLPDVSLSRIYTLIRKGKIRVGGRRRAASYRIERGDVLELPEELAPSGGRGNGTPGGGTDAGADGGVAGVAGVGATIPADLADRVVYENEHLLAIDKPVGMPVHGRNGLLAALRPYLEDGARKSISFRPGPIHRLDRNTSGLMLFPRSLRGSQRASELLRTGRLEKGYLALLSGRLPGVEVWGDVLERDRSRNVTRVVDGAEGAGRAARSVAAPLVGGSAGTEGSARGDTEVTLALIRIETGRTHQIRAQAEAHGYPLLGDAKYGGGGGRAAGGGRAPGSAGRAPGGDGRGRADSANERAADPPGAYFLHAAVLINQDPDEIFPARVICAPPGRERRQELDARLGVRDAAAAELDAALSCTALSESLSALVYKEPGNQ